MTESMGADMLCDPGESRVGTEHSLDTSACEPTIVTASGGDCVSTVV